MKSPYYNQNQRFPGLQKTTAYKVLLFLSCLGKALFASFRAAKEEQNWLNQIPGFEKVHFHANNGPRETLGDIREKVKARQAHSSDRKPTFWCVVAIVICSLIIIGIFAQILI